MATIPRVKICCIANINEARLAIEYGASALGLVSEMPSGPGVISQDKIAEIAAFVPPHIATFLLTSKTDVAEIIEQHQFCRTTTLQIVDQLTAGTYRDLREALPGISLVQVVHVYDDKSREEAISIASDVDAILLDSGNPSANIKELGGTGRTHNWDISRQIVEQLSIPVFLAGGLNPGNIKSAIQSVKPFGVDVCSGVRKDDQLDEEKLGLFFKNIRQADE
jgi:phosphoribosylanthranilate isomerase